MASVVECLYTVDESVRKRNENGVYGPDGAGFCACLASLSSDSNSAVFGSRCIQSETWWDTAREIAVIALQKTQVNRLVVVGRTHEYHLRSEQRNHTGKFTLLGETSRLETNQTSQKDKIPFIYHADIAV